MTLVEIRFRCQFLRALILAAAFISATLPPFLSLRHIFISAASHAFQIYAALALSLLRHFRDADALLMILRRYYYFCFRYFSFDADAEAIIFLSLMAAVDVSLFSASLRFFIAQLSLFSAATFRCYFVAFDDSFMPFSIASF
jgi:hypothetical protein